jgi:hypothetical protein
VLVSSHSVTGGCIPLDCQLHSMYSKGIRSVCLKQEKMNHHEFLFLFLVFVFFLFYFLKIDFGT